MKTDPWNEDSREPRLDENDPVWRLLEESPRPEPDAWFTVRTLARCRLAEPETESRGMAWSGLWRWMLGTGTGFGLAVILMMTHVFPTSMMSDKQKNAQEAFEIMASIPSSDADTTSSTSWQESSL
jgi:hypothetical protein